MATSKQLVEYVLEQLQGLGRLTSRRMFSGVGLYSDGLFFGLLYHDRLYFKTDDTTRPEYEARGSEGFRPRPNIMRLKMRYYTVPADVLEDPEELVNWARRATAVALASESATTAKRPAGERGQRKEGHGKGRPAKEGARTALPGNEGQRNARSRNEGQRKAHSSNEGQSTVRPRKVAPATPPATARAAAKKRAKSSG
jgi:DNA transformation protein